MGSTKRLADLRLLSSANYNVLFLALLGGLHRRASLSARLAELALVNRIRRGGIPLWFCSLVHDCGQARQYLLGLFAGTLVHAGLAECSGHAARNDWHLAGAAIGPQEATKCARDFAHRSLGVMRLSMDKGLSPSSKLVTVVLTIGLMVFGLFFATLQQSGTERWVTVTRSNPAAHTDLALYEAIAKRVEAGQPYYPVALDEHRARRYPVKPFLTVRLPTLAEIRATTGTGATVNTAIGLLFVLVISLSWWARFRPLVGSKHFVDEAPMMLSIISMALLVSSLTIYISGNFLFMHEVWAGGLLAIALALYRPENPLPTMIAAAAALAIRETSLPFILLFGAYAAYHRRWKEGLGWASIALAFGLYLAWHANKVSSLTYSTDLSGPGWGSFGGWSTYLSFMRDTTILRFFPLAVSAILLPLCLVGWLGAKQFDGRLMSLFHIGYALIFMIMGRPDNYYWGFMVAPTLLMGLAFLPQLVADMRQRWTEAPISG